MDFDLDNLDLDLPAGESDIDVSDLSLDTDGSEEFTPDALNAALGIEDLVLDDSSLSTDSISDGSDISIDFDDISDDTFDATTVLRTQVDISHEFKKYYQYTSKALSKVNALRENVDVEFTRPAFSKFNFIGNEQTKRMVYGHFCSTLETLTTNEKYAGISLEDAWKTLLETMYEEIHYTPSIYADTLFSIFKVYFKQNQKLVSASVISNTQTIADVINYDKLQTANLVYYINSIPWDIADRFYADVTLANTDAVVGLNGYGDFTVEAVSSYNARSINHKELFSYIVGFLSSDEVFNMLQLNVDQKADFSTGELLRRYVQYEINSGDMYLVGVSQLSKITDIATLLQTLFVILNTGLKKQSIAAEILCLTLELMFANTKGKRGHDDYLYPFVQSLSSFLVACENNIEYINPVFYTYIGNLSTDDEELFELGYAIGDNSETIQADNVLCEVIGDKQAIYHIPEVYVDKKTKSVICPPSEVVEGLRRQTPFGKLAVSNNVCYRYTPSFAWLSTLNLSTSLNLTEDKNKDTVISQISDPLLDTLINYTNDFDTDTSLAQVKVIKTDNSEIIGVQSNNSEGLKVLSYNDGNTVQKVMHGLCVDSGDGGLIIRYMNGFIGDEQVMVLDNGEYTISQVFYESTKNSGLHLFDTMLSVTTYPSFPADYAYMRETNKRICDLIALDYESILKQVRTVIVRDLSSFIGLQSIDLVLGAEAFKNFLNFSVKYCESSLDGFNFGTFKDLWGVLYGEPNILSDVQEPSKDIIYKAALQFKQDYADGKFSFDAIMKTLNSLDVHVFAMHACSKSELSNSGEYSVYKAMHAVPGIHEWLRVLEEQMVLLNVLMDAGPDIFPVINKNSAMALFYKKVCTVDSILNLEKDLIRGMRQKEKQTCLTMSRRILLDAPNTNYSIVKYFILERNLYGVMTELESCFASGDQKYKAFYDKLRSELKFTDSDKEIGLMTEQEFHKRVAQSVVNTIFADHHAEFVTLLTDGLVAEANMNVDLKVVETYDMFTTFGFELFKFSASKAEDFSDTSEAMPDFYSYAGSFFLTYAPVMGEAANDIDGGFDRYSAYLKNRKDFITSVDLMKLEQYKLSDLHYVSATESDEIAESKRESLGFSEE